MAQERTQSVVRVFGVLDAIADLDGRAGVGEIARATGLAESTTHRLLATLVGLGCVRRLPDRRYALAARLIHLGSAAAAALGTQSRPILERIVDELGESANLAVLSGDQAEYIAQSASRHAMRMFTEVGRRVDLTCTGVGKAMLSALPDDRVREILDQGGLPRRTEHSITDRAVLLAELARARESGYCLDEQEQELGVRCVAMPIVLSPTAVLAVSVSGPLTRMTDALVARAVPLLRAAAAEIASYRPR